MSLTKSLSRLVIGSAIIAICGCAPQPAVVPDRPATDPAIDARTLQRAGDFRAAADAYLRIAAPAEPAAERRFRALAVEAYLDAGDLEHARQWGFEREESTGAAPETTALEAVNRARLAYREGNLQQGAELIRSAPLDRLSPYSRARALGVNAELAERRDEPLAAARIRIGFDAWLGIDALQHANRQAIWRNLLAVPTPDLRSLADAPDPLLAGWSRLALLARESVNDTPRFRTDLARWQADHAGHPANGMIDELLALRTRLTTRPSRIALLLPFNGPFAAAAIAIRDGFITAWYGDTTNPNRPIIRTYNATETNITAIYQQAIADGAEFIVGPLAKDALLALLDRQPLPVMTLALNTLDAADQRGPPRDNLVQFGLPPEHEAREVAKRARADGHRRGIVLAPDTSWGKRVAATFTAQWLELGGEIAESLNYQGSIEQYADSVEKVLNVDASKLRHRQLQQTLGRTLAFELRPRRDIDFIFVAGFPVDARQILPQLRFLRAGDVPVYATHEVFTGVVNATQDQDLDGVIFGDMPWLFGLHDADSLRLIRDAWNDRFNGYGRFYAFGMDAYRIIPFLGRLLVQRDTRLAGNTGYLRLNAQAVIDRQLAWARFGGGVPIPLGEPTVAAPASAPAP